MRIVAIIQARLASTRLPGKCLIDLCGKPLIDHVIARAQAIKGIHSVVLNIPAGDMDLIHQGMTYAVSDQEKDVLGSYVTVAEQERADVVVRITGDCPLLAPDLAERVIQLYKALRDPFVYCANDTLRSGYPDGTDVEVFSLQALRLSSVKVLDASDREHVTPWLRRAMPNYGILNPAGASNGYGPKWSVDEKKDLELVRRIHAQLEHGNYSYQATYDACVLAERGQD